jgi:hypothetical protein
MGKLKKKKLVNLIGSLVLIVSLAPIVSCGVMTTTYKPLDSTDGSAYKTFTTPNDSRVHFSFGYPSSYVLTDESAGQSNPEISVHFSATTKEDFEIGRFKYIEIEVTNLLRHSGYPDAETAMKRRINEYKWSWSRNYRLVTKHRVVVDGVEGWETIISFRHKPYQTFDPWPTPKQNFVVYKDLFFDYQGMTWRIYLETDADSYKQQASADFEHVLRTFKFPK